MSSSNLKLKRSGQMPERAFQRLVEAVLKGDVKGGMILREVRLARQWKIGRTPLREALRRAAESGFVLLRPNRPPIVHAPSEQDIRDLYELRELLEMRAFHIAWPQITTEDIRGVEKLASQANPSTGKRWQKRSLRFDVALHELWTKQCTNTWIANDLRRHYRLLHVFINWFGRSDETLLAAYREHVGILDALKRQNEQEAGELLRAHIRRAASVVGANVPKVI